MGDFDVLAGAWRLLEPAHLGVLIVRFWVNPGPGWFWLEVTVAGGGVLGGPWRASRTGAFLAGISGSWNLAPECRHDEVRAWISEAASFTGGSDELVLHDGDGRLVARLTRAPDARMDAHVQAPQQQVPDVSTGLVAAEGEQLLGAWQPILPTPGALPWQNIEFRGDGRWRTFPRGVVAGGRWTAASEGTLLAIHPYAKPLAYSPVQDVDSWLLAVARAGFDRDVLVLFDDHGHQLQRLRRLEHGADTGWPRTRDRQRPTMSVEKSACSGHD